MIVNKCKSPLSSLPLFSLPAVVFIAFFMSLFSTVAQAETRYVTDKIVLELHETKSGLSPLVAQLPSGAKLNVLEKDGAHARVETSDGKTGWVEAAYLMSSKPAQVLYQELKQEHQRNLMVIQTLQANKISTDQIPEQTLEDAKNIGWMRGEMNKARKKAKELEEKLQNIKTANGDFESDKNRLQGKITELETRLKSATIENEENMAEINRLIGVIENKELFTTAGMETQIPLLWYLISIGVFLVIGVVTGIYMLDTHNRKRHGGFRI